MKTFFRIIWKTFKVLAAATGILFGGMAAASLIFKMELDSIRPLLFGGLIMLIIVGVLGMFLNLGAFNVMICYLGIAIFLGYTAYDTAKIRQNYEYYSQMGDSVILEKASIFSALQLYLDFVNLFLYETSRKQQGQPQVSNKIYERPGADICPRRFFAVQIRQSRNACIKPLLWHSNAFRNNLLIIIKMC